MDTFPVSALIRHNPASELSLERACGNIRAVQKISKIVCWAGIGVLLLFLFSWLSCAALVLASLCFAFLQIPHFLGGYSLQRRWLWH